MQLTNFEQQLSASENSYNNSYVYNQWSNQRDCGPYSYQNQQSIKEREKQQQKFDQLCQFYEDHDPFFQNLNELIEQNY